MPLAAPVTKVFSLYLGVVTKALPDEPACVIERTGLKVGLMPGKSQ